MKRVTLDILENYGDLICICTFGIRRKYSDSHSDLNLYVCNNLFSLKDGLFFEMVEEESKDKETPTISFCQKEDTRDDKEVGEKRIVLDLLDVYVDVLTVTFIGQDVYSTSFSIRDGLHLKMVKTEGKTEMIEI